MLGSFSLISVKWLVEEGTAVDPVDFVTANPAATLARDSKNL